MKPVSFICLLPAAAAFRNITPVRQDEASGLYAVLRFSGSWLRIAVTGRVAFVMLPVLLVLAKATQRVCRTGGRAQGRHGGHRNGIRNAQNRKAGT